MNKLSKISILLIFTLMLGMLNAPQVAVASGSVSAQAGDTIYYDVTKLILNPPDDVEDWPFADPLDLSSSTLYAKVLDVNNEFGSYYDPNTDTQVSSTAPVVDLAVGAILGTSVTATLPNVTDPVVLPQGMGIPLPFLFSSSSIFGFEVDGSDTTLPFPLFMADDWTLQQAIIDNDLPNGMSIVNDAAQFKIVGTDVLLGSNTTDPTADFSVAWDKSNGLLTSFDFTLTENDGNVSIDIQINFDRMVNVGINLSVDDIIEISLNDFNFDFTTSGGANDIAPDLNNIRNNLTMLDGETLLKFEITDISGLYYEADVYAYNIQTDSLEYVDSVWFVGFGKLGVGIGAHTSIVSDSGMMMVGDGTSPVVTGPVVTPEYDLFSAWDITNQFMLQSANNLIVLGMDEALADEDIISSSFDLTSSLTASFDTNGYTQLVTADLDMAVEVNETWTDNIWNGTAYENISSYDYTDMTATGSISAETDYDNYGHLSTFDFSGNMNLNVISNGFDAYTNETYDDSGSISITDLSYTINVAYTFADGSAHGGDFAGVDSGTVDEPGLTNPLPGFTALYAIVAMIVAAPIIRKFRK